MKKQRGALGVLVGLLMPLVLILGGAGLVALGVMETSLVLIVVGAVVAAAGVLWGVMMFELANPFDWF